MLEYPSLPIEPTLFINSCKQYQSWSNIDYTLSSESVELSNDLLLSVCWKKVKWLYIEWIENNTPELVVGWLWWELPPDVEEGASHILKIFNNIWLQQYFSTHEQYV